MSQSLADIARTREEILRRMQDAARAAGRAPRGVALVAVCKQQPMARIKAMVAAGQKVFGENRVQEAARHWPQHVAGAQDDLRLHLIGPLQTNKAPDAVRLFDVVETLDRPKLAEALAKAMDKTGCRPDVFVQVNTGEEPQKAGIGPAEADAFIAAVRNNYDLPLKGLMCIPPATEEPAMHFALLRKIAQANGLAQLSMGMSHDFETAIAFGATHVRVGTALFGMRQPR